MKTYRAAPGSYLVFASITGAIGFLWLMAIWRTDAPWIPLFLPAAGFLAAMLWLSRFRITLDERNLTVRIPLRATQFLPRSEILTVELAEELGRTEAPMTLCIRTSNGQEVSLNAKVFSGKAVEALMRLGVAREQDGSARSIA